MRKKNKKSNDSYANAFKPAIILDTATMDQMLNRIYIQEFQEDFDENNNQLLYSGLGHDGDSGNPDAKSIFSLQTIDPSIKPDVRSVVVSGKQDFNENSFLVETERNGLGVAIVMIKEVVEKNEVYCNIRFMPFSRMADLLSTTSGTQLKVSIPSSNVIKLNVTLKPSKTSEVLFKTHKTEVDLENISDADGLAIKQMLEFNGALIAAHYAGLVVEVSPSVDSQNKMTVSLSEDQFIQLSQKAKQRLLVVGLIATVIGGSVLTIGSIATYGVFTWQTTAAVFNTIGGINRGLVGVAGTREPNPEEEQLNNSDDSL